MGGAGGRRGGYRRMVDAPPRRMGQTEREVRAATEALYYCKE